MVADPVGSSVVAFPESEIKGINVLEPLGLLKNVTVKSLLPVSAASQFNVTGNISV